jgi:hypothetical protein
VRIDEIVLRALETKPELRYQTAGEFRTQVVTMTSGTDAPPPVEPRVASVPSRFSRPAIVGACWVPVTFISFLAIGFGLYKLRSGPATGLEWWQVALMIPPLILGVGGLFGTTILGWVAVSHIRHSEGRLQGLQLAVFDGLVFPLMTVSAVIALGGVALAKMFVDFYSNPSVIGEPHGLNLVARMANWLSQNTEFAVVMAVIAAAVVDVLIVRAVQRAVRSPAKKTTDAAPSGSRVSPLFGLALLLLALGSGGFQMVREHTAHQTRIGSLSRRIHQLQREWTAAQTEAFHARTAASRLEVKVTNARTDAERQQAQIERNRLTNDLSKAVTRGDDILGQVQTTTETINHLRFPTLATLAKALWPAGLLLIGGVFLLFRRGAHGERSIHDSATGAFNVPGPDDRSVDS